MSIIRCAKASGRAAAAAAAALFFSAPAAAQVQKQFSDTLRIEEVLQQRELVDSAQRAAEEALRRTGAEIATAFTGLSEAYQQNKDAMQAWLSDPTEETETAYIEAGARSVNASVRHLDAVAALQENLRSRVAPVDRMLRGYVRRISDRLVKASGYVASIQAANAEYQREYDRVALKLVQTGQIDALDALSLEEKAALLGLEVNIQLLAFVEATMTQNEIGMRAARERFRLYRQSLRNSVILAGTVSEQAKALQGAFQAVGFVFASAAEDQEVGRAFEGVLSLEEGLSDAASGFLEQGLAIARFALPDPTWSGEAAGTPLDLSTIEERVRARADSLINNSNRD